MAATVLPSPMFVDGVTVHNTDFEPLASAARELQGRHALAVCNPGGNLNTPASGGPTLWVDMGLVTVPAWATSALATVSLVGVTVPAAGTYNVNARLRIGAATGAVAPRLSPGLATGAYFNQAWSDSVAGVVPGSRTVALYATLAGGTGTFRLESGNGYASCAIVWLG